MAKRICVPCSIICLCQGPLHKVFRWQSFATVNHSLFMALWNFINFTWKPAQTIRILRSFWIIIKYIHIQIFDQAILTWLDCDAMWTKLYFISRVLTQNLATKFLPFELCVGKFSLNHVLMLRGEQIDTPFMQLKLAALALPFEVAIIQIFKWWCDSN